MPIDIHDADTGGTSLVFTGEAAGVRFRLADGALYDAAEVRIELHGDDALEDDHEAEEEGQPPAYGRWIRAEAEDEELWMVAPGELVDELQRLEVEVGDLLEVTRIEKSGSRSTDPFEVNLDLLEDGEQTRL